MWYEVFSAGEHTDSSGNKKNYSFDDLDKIIELSNKRLDADPNDKTPIVKGHPKSDDPSFGYVKRMARRGEKLVADLEITNQDFQNELNSGAFKNISISLYDDLNVKHIGFLGAVNPAIKDLKKLEFSESESPNPDELHSLQNENTKLNQKIKILEKEKRLIEYRNFAESLLHCDNPVIIPAQINDLVDLLEMTHEYDLTTNFNEENTQSNYSTKLKNLLNNKTINNYNKEIIPNTEFTFSNNFEGKNLDENRLNLHKKAKELQNIEPLLSYEEAICKASNFIYNF